MAYCTVAQAQAAGAVGDPTTVITPAIAAAKEIIDRYTGDIFQTTTGVVVMTQVGSGGVALLPHRVQTVDTVEIEGSPGVWTALATAGYTVHSSATKGDTDSLHFWLGGANMLVAGAEPWAGGWNNLFTYGRGLRVTGTFGWLTTPIQAQDACALLAAWRTASPSNYSDSSMTSGSATVKSLSTEGYSVTWETAQGAAGAQTTGLPGVDRLLAPLRRQRLVTAV